jgi:predicted transposase/invertase (TIGR01784 family)
MQMNPSTAYVRRALFYWSRFYSEQLKSADLYTKLLPTISIHILNFELFKKTSSFHHEFAILEKQRQTLLTDHFEMHFLEIPKVPEGHREHLAAWLLFLQNPEANYMEVLMKENPIIEKAHSKLKELSADESLHLIAEARLKAQWDYNSGMAYARDQGLAEGEARGEAKGKAEGLAKGKAEGQKLAAEKMLQSGMSDVQVASILGLSLSEIQSILKNSV